MIYWLVFMSVVIVFLLFHMIPSKNNKEGLTKTVAFTVVIAVLITSIFAGLSVLFGL